MLERRAATEFRSEGRRLEGTAIRYGDTAVIHGQLERFEPGSFSDFSDIRMDVQHDARRILTRVGSGLEMADGPDALRFVANLPNTREADDALEMVRKGILRGASVEFIASSERHEDRVRVISGADLLAISAVENPAYKKSHIEARQASSFGLRGAVHYERLHVTSNTGAVRKTRLKRGALDFALDEDREISVNLGSSLNSTLGTRSSGTLEVVKQGNAISISVPKLPDTQAAHDLVGLSRAGIGVHVRPRYTTEGVDNAYRDVPELGSSDVLIREIDNALLLGFDLTVRGGNNGYDPIELTGRRPRRRRFYV